MATPMSACLSHGRDAHREHDGHRRRQPLGDGADGERHRGVEGVAERPAAQGLEPEEGGGGEDAPHEQAR
ncbi:MAG TPA: hypothetical protein VFS00_01480, partial [Polyangiaceae bacterium]|nr:hypothetical protein [Polyangiaceae bacterium]